MKPQPIIAAVFGIIVLSGAGAIAEEEIPAAPAAPQLRIATVDMQELFKQYHRTNEAQKQINVERARIQKDNNERLARIRDLEEKLGKLRKELEDPAVNESKKQHALQGVAGTAAGRHRARSRAPRVPPAPQPGAQRKDGPAHEGHP